MLHTRPVELVRLPYSTLATATDTTNTCLVTLLVILTCLTGLVLPHNQPWPGQPWTATTATTSSHHQRAPPWTEDIVLFESVAQSAISEESSGGDSQVTAGSIQPPPQHAGLSPSQPPANSDKRPRGSPRSSGSPRSPGSPSSPGSPRSQVKSEDDKFSDQGYNHANSFGFSKATNPSFPFGILFQSKDLSVETSKLSYLQKRSAAVPTNNKTEQVDSFDFSSRSHDEHPAHPNHAQEAEYPELTSDSGVRSISNHSLLSQCLSSENCTHFAPQTPTNNASVAAEQICSNATKLRLRLTLLHPDHHSVCWSRTSCPPPVLDKKQVRNIESEDPDTCREQVEKILVQIQEFNFNIEQTLKVLQSGHGMECTNSSGCQACKDWYLAWLCLNYWPVFLGDSMVPPCPAQCGTVQTSCPFHMIFEDSSMAAGDPTFLCQDSAIASRPQSSKHQACCFEVHLQLPNQTHGDQVIPAPRQGEYVDLNTTHSCSNLLPMGTTPTCDSSRIELANRTLLVKRREPTSTSSVSGVFLDWVGLTSCSVLCRLQPAIVFIWTYSYKFYTL